MKKLAAVAVFLGMIAMPLVVRANEGAPADLGQKLNKILANQTQILSELDEIKKELAIVKVRATLAGS